MDRKTYLLGLKAARTYLIAHPGCTSREIQDASGFGVSKLQTMGLAFWKKDEAGVTRWYAKSGIAWTKKETS